MTRRWASWAICASLLLGTARASGQSYLPVADDADFPALRTQCVRLLKGLEALKAPLAGDVEKELGLLIAEKANPGPDAAVKLQKLLDARCLVGVHINPESRVKAARGALVAELRKDQACYVLIKVHNEAGVTAPLAVAGPQIRNGTADADRWLEAAVVKTAPLQANLTGGKVDYLVLRLTAHEAGKREATLRFDVGQGTQDLGFRAEVPILFTVRE